MVPRDHGFGKSFKGVGAYLLHDKNRAVSNDRVAWTHVHNMGTQNAETAFSVMAAVAMDQRRLKEQAHDREQAALPEDQRKAFRNSGRKSDAHVWHYSLSWSPEEAENLTREEMIEAAKASLSVLGKDKGKGHDRRQYADEHQAIFVCHDDEPQPHVHVVVNRVHPDHGKMLSKYNDWQKFSKWAQGYEEERGKVYCMQRVANNQMRDQRKLDRASEQYKVYGQGNLPHHLSTAKSKQREAANDNVSLLERTQERERAKNVELAKKSREQAQKQRQEKAAILARYREQRTEQNLALAERRKVSTAKIMAAHQHEQLMILERQETALLEFEIRERDLAGKARNIWETIKTQWSVRSSQDRKFRLSDYYKPMTGEAARLEAFKQAQFAKQREFEIEREKQLQYLLSRAQQDREAERDASRQAYVAEQQRLKDEHAAQQRALKAEWAQRNEQRSKALAAAQELSKRVQAAERVKAAEAFNEAAQARENAQEQAQGGDDRAKDMDQRRAEAKSWLERAKAQHAKAQEQAQDKTQPAQEPQSLEIERPALPPAEQQRSAEQCRKRELAREWLDKTKAKHEQSQNKGRSEANDQDRSR